MVKGQFRVDVMGVRHPNADGSDRRDIIRDCEEGESLVLKHMPVEQDKNAVAIFTMSGEQLGWIPRWYAKEIAPCLKRGETVKASIDEIKGGNCTILITKMGDSISNNAERELTTQTNNPSPGGKICGACGAKVADKVKKCPTCGKTICINCGNPIGSGVTKCPKCGEATTIGGIQSIGCLLFAIGIFIIIFMVLFFIMC